MKKIMPQLSSWLGFALVLVGLRYIVLGSPTGYAQAPQRYFPETGHTVTGRFLSYWEAHGGLYQHGYPLSEELQERSDTDGKTYTVQYFERSVFEKHPELAPPNDVLLSLLGVFAYEARYAREGAPNQKASNDRAVVFRETGRSLGGAFRRYWEAHGGLSQQGFPISDEFQERNVLDGKLYTVQYFERAVFEHHPENAGTPYEVLLSHLGRERFQKKHDAEGQSTPALSAVPATSTPQPTASSLPQDLRAQLLGVSTVSENEGWAVGGTIPGGVDGERGLLLHYRDGVWEQFFSPTAPGQYLLDVDMISPGEGWAGGNEVILHYSGGRWEAQASVKSGGYPAQVLDLDMVSVDEGWALTQISVAPPRGGYNTAPTMMRYAGGEWTEVKVPAQVSCLAMVAGGEGWAFGSSTVLRYAGNEWQNVSANHPFTGTINSVDMVAYDNGWAVGDEGTILHYNGSRWERIASPAGADVELRSVRMISRDDGWAVGSTENGKLQGVILRYSNGTWNKVYSLPNTFLSDVSMVSADEGWAVGGKRVDTGGGNFSTRYLILRYRNGTWSEHSQ